MKITFSEMFFENNCLALGYSKSPKVKMWAKKMIISTCKMGLGGIL
jgi:predicted outer membrane protein